MEKEISSGAMLGIVLIALAAIIGIGFGIFAIAKGTANTGVTNVQEGLEGVSQSAYTDYDQTIVTGQQVKSAYNNFEGKSTAVLIATQAFVDATSTGAVDAKAAGIAEKYGKASAVPVVKIYGDEEKKNALGLTTSKGAVVGVGKELMLNYNALIGNDKGGYANSDSTTSGVPEMYFDNNCFRAVNGYYTNNGKIGLNNIAGNMTKSGMVEYLPTSARFQAYLIKDKSGTTMGVAFYQITSK